MLKPSSSSGRMSSHSPGNSPKGSPSSQPKLPSPGKSSTGGGLSPPHSPLSPRTLHTTYTAASEMLELKHDRKRAETDLQLLANRIAILKLEEQKAMAKVQETKTRAQEILE